MKVVHEYEGVVKPLGNSGRVQPAIPGKLIGKRVIVKVLDEETMKDTEENDESKNKKYKTERKKIGDKK
ncbi:putative transposon-encoded protein [Methanococcus voltae PS]|uniref:Transposon-encoded protein n=1 Tax=Methanococcus voltae PS TaxID=523842 RepID=A0ABT2EVL5_METVO|nr:DUF2080 family transposase-associated protein [Methanococcus voltae]MCS3921995.1 putative transposon-encoded protein [Methanococcus voltae PS]